MELEYELEELLQEQLYEHGLPALHIEQVQRLAEYTLRAYNLVPKRTSLDRLYVCMKQYVQTPFGKKALQSIAKASIHCQNNVLLFKSTSL